MRKFTLVLLLFLLISSIQVLAQGIVTYGGAVVGTLSAQAPIAIYTFQGTEGDQVTIQAIAITPDLDLTMTVQSGTEILATADSDPFTKARPMPGSMSGYRRTTSIWCWYPARMRRPAISCSNSTDNPPPRKPSLPDYRLM